MPILLRAVLAVHLLVGLAFPAAIFAQEAGIEKEDFFEPGIAPVRAPAGYDLTIVYFMDYQCPACRQYTPDVARVLAEDRKVRVIYRDTPILSDLSTVAARAAIASAFQGRHDAFHHALMMTKGQLSEAAIRTAADKARVDWPRLQRDLKARGEAIELQIARNFELSVATGIQGTPAFIVGDRLSNGALDYASLKAEIADARASQAKSLPAKALLQPVAPAAAEETRGQPAAPTAPVAVEAKPPLFRPVDPRPAPVEKDSDGEYSTAWLALAALLAAGSAAAFIRFRRRGSRTS